MPGNSFAPIKSCKGCIRHIFGGHNCRWVKRRDWHASLIIELGRGSRRKNNLRLHVAARQFFPETPAEIQNEALCSTVKRGDR